MRAFLAAAVVVAVTNVPALAESDPVIATVDGRAITQSASARQGGSAARWPPRR
jgi:hypothetical protein